MKRFRFSLQRVLDLRSALVRQGRLELSAALARARSAHHALEAAREQHMVAAQRAVAEELRGIPAAGMAAARLHLDRLAADIEARRRALSEATAEVDACKARLDRRRRDERALERLRERRRLAHAAAVAAEEQRALDEAATVRFGRRVGGGP